jgi:hypothetical protein
MVMWPSKRQTAALLCIWLVACVPIAVSREPPLVDYPSHLVRVYLLANWDDLTGYDKFYRPAWAILPNLSLELVGLPLARVLPARHAMRVFCAIVVGLLVFGGAWLLRAVSGQWTPWSFAPALLVYNYIFAFGFVSFLFGLGIALFALAFHVAGRDRPLPRRLLRELILMLALVTSHFIALVIYLVGAVAYDALSALAEHRSLKELERDYDVLGASVCPSFMFLTSAARAPTNTVELSSLSWKVTKFIQILRTGQGVWDDAFAAAAVAVILALLATRHLRLRPIMAGVTLAFLLLFAVTPYRIGYASNLDTRLPLVVLFAGLAALEIRGRRTVVVAAAVLILLFARVTAATLVYHRSSQELERMTADLSVIPPGALVFTARQDSAPVWSPEHWNPPLPHASELLLMKQPFWSATLFTDATQHPFVRTHEFARLNVPPTIGEATRPELESYAARMTATLEAAGRTEPAYVYLLKGSTAPASTPRFELVLDRPRFAVYRLVR